MRGGRRARARGIDCTVAKFWGQVGRCGAGLVREHPSSETHGIRKKVVFGEGRRSLVDTPCDGLDGGWERRGGGEGGAEGDGGGPGSVETGSAGAQRCRFSNCRGLVSQNTGKSSNAVSQNTQSSL